MIPTRRRGFTLIELLIVVVIIGILAAIAIPKFSSVRQKSFRSSMMSDLRNLAVAQEVYHNSSFTYTNSLTALEAVVSDGVSVTVTEATNTGWAATATHSGVAGEQCGMFNGTAAAANGSPATAVGVVTCTY
jgi:prepilin-type N-terminal cleavage/methylation domain-containing protein